MSKPLIFNDGSQLQVCDASTIYNVITIFTSPSDAIEAWELFTRENLVHGYIGEDEFINIIPLDLDMIKDDDGVIIARFESRDKTQVELAKEELSKIMYSVQGGYENATDAYN